MMCDHDVGGFDIPVDDALLMRVLHGVADLEKQGQPGMALPSATPL
jgi:hypothetical protein